METQLIPLELIDSNPWQTRQREDPKHVEEIAHSIRAMGMMQVPSARKVGERYQLAFGHTRLAAYKLLESLGADGNYSYMPLSIREISDEQMAISAFEENEKRKDLNPVEKAKAVQKMLNDFGWTQEQIAVKLHLDRSGISNLIRMLRLPADFLESVEEGSLPARSAMAMIPLCEISETDKTRLVDRFAGSYSDFLNNARTGQLTSDIIRARVEFYLNFLNPKQGELFDNGEGNSNEEPLPGGLNQVTYNPDMKLKTDSSFEEGQSQVENSASTAVIQATQATIHDWPNPTDEGSNETKNKEPHEEIERENDGRDHDQKLEAVSHSSVGFEDGNLPAQEPALPADESKPDSHPAEQAPAPAASQPQTATDPNETILTIIWKTSGVIVSVKKPGTPLPLFRHYKELPSGQIPMVMYELGITPHGC